MGWIRGFRYRVTHGFVLVSAPRLRVHGFLQFRGHHGTAQLGRNARLYGAITLVFEDATSSGCLRTGPCLQVENGVVLAPRGGSIVLGANCFLGDLVLLQSCIGTSITVGDHVMIAKGASLYASNHNFERLDLPMKLQGESGQGIVVEDDVWIGANAVILDGVRLGRGCVVAAGAVVKRDVPPGEIVGGVPARFLKRRWELPEDAIKS